MPDKKNEMEEEKVDVTKEAEQPQKDGHSGVFTSDGEELPEIEGGYTISGTGTDPQESDFLSV